MRRLTKIFGGDTKLMDIGRETNTLVSDLTTVICLDDYHKYDRKGRAETGITALAKDCQDWDKMAGDVTGLKSKSQVDKPIYNHITGALDAPETIVPNNIMIFEGLHPFVDPRVLEAIDFSIYLDISDDIKYAWKLQRDVAERGATPEEVQKAIAGRKGDFDAFVAPQRSQADVVIQVLPSDVVKDATGKYLKVRMIQKIGNPLFTPAVLAEDKCPSWAPDADKIPSSVGLKVACYDENFMGNDCKVLEVDGAWDSVESLSVIEEALCNTGAKKGGELTEIMVGDKAAVGSDNGTGFLQALCSLKLREVYEKLA
jgi:phosphoribulokinase